MKRGRSNGSGVPASVKTQFRHTVKKQQVLKDRTRYNRNGGRGVRVNQP